MLFLFCFCFCLYFVQTFESESRRLIKSCGKNKQKKKEAQEQVDADKAALEARHQEEMEALLAEEQPQDEGKEQEQTQDQEEKEETQEEGEDDIAARKREKKLRKQRKKREKAMEEEKKRQEERIEGLSKSARVSELEAIQAICLDPIQYHIHEVPADGNCLFRAISRQLNIVGDAEDRANEGFERIREICVQEIEQKREEFEPFMDKGEEKSLFLFFLSLRGILDLYV